MVHFVEAIEHALVFFFFLMLQESVLREIQNYKLHQGNFLSINKANFVQRNSTVNTYRQNPQRKADGTSQCCVYLNPFQLCYISYRTQSFDQYCQSDGFDMQCKTELKWVGTSNQQIKIFLKKNFMAPSQGWGSIAPRLQSHYDGAAYCLPLSSQKLTSKG